MSALIVYIASVALKMVIVFVVLTALILIALYRLLKEIKTSKQKNFWLRQTMDWRKEQYLREVALKNDKPWMMDCVITDTIIERSIDQLDQSIQEKIRR